MRQPFRFDMWFYLSIVSRNVIIFSYIILKPNTYVLNSLNSITQYHRYQVGGAREISLVVVWLWLKGIRKHILVRILRHTLSGKCRVHEQEFRKLSKVKQRFITLDQKVIVVLSSII